MIRTALRRATGALRPAPQARCISEKSEALFTGLVQAMRDAVPGGVTEVTVGCASGTFLVHPEVFNVGVCGPPTDFLTHQPLAELARKVRATEGSTDRLEVLEVGPGMGQFTVLAAEMSERVNVTAVDVNPAAVTCTKANAEHRGVADRVTAGLGDVYKADVVGEKKFDLIWWDPPFSKGDSDLANKSSLERALWDPEYAGVTQFVRDARNFLKPGGEVVVCFSDFFGDQEFLRNVCAEHNWKLRIIGSASYPLIEATNYITYTVYEMVDTASS